MCLRITDGNKDPLDLAIVTRAGADDVRTHEHGRIGREAQHARGAHKLAPDFEVLLHHHVRVRGGATVHVAPEADTAKEQERLAIEVLKAHALTLCQQVVLWRREVQALAHEKHAAHARCFSCANGQVDKGVEEGALNVRLVAHHLGAHERTGHALHDERREVPQRRRRDGPHTQHTLAPRCVERRLAHAPLGGEKLLGVRQQLASHAVERKRVLAAVKERHAKILLKMLDGAAERRLGDVLLARGGRHRTCAGNGNKVAYLVGVHTDAPLSQQCTLCMARTHSGIVLLACAAASLVEKLRRAP